MASASVAGQQPGLEPDPRLRKAGPLRRASWDRMMLRRSAGEERGVRTPAEAPRSAEPGGGGATDGHRGAQRRRGSAHGAAARDGSGGGGGGGFPLERLTQGRTGVVRLARTEPPRREAWAIFSPESGAGHRFEAKSLARDWCDACSRQVTAQALQCQNCSYTCHPECEGQVRLDCNRRDKEPDGTPPSRSRRPATDLRRCEAKEGGTKELSEEEVRTKIKEYNSLTKYFSENTVNLAPDGSYSGFIKVQLRLSRPVTVLAAEAEGASGPTDAGCGEAASGGHERTDRGQSDKKTSFYLPSNCVKQTHIGSRTTTRELIQGLLKKFMVLDNPSKFALYKHSRQDGQDLFQRLPPHERPLLLRLIAGPDPEQLSFVLKENNTGDVEWHGFSLPELQNFLAILEKEETERVRAVESKYGVYRQKLQQALQQHDP